MYLNDILHRRLNLITLKGNITVTTCNAPPLFCTTQSAALHPSGVHSDLITEALWTFIVHAIWATSRRVTTENLLLLPWHVFVETVKRVTARSHEASALVWRLAERRFPLQFNADWELLRFFKAAVRWKSQKCFQKRQHIKVNNQVSFFFFSFKHTKRCWDGSRSARGVKLLQLKHSCNVSGDTEVTFPDVYNLWVPCCSLKDNSN